MIFTHEAKKAQLDFHQMVNDNAEHPYKNTIVNVAFEGEDLAVVKTIRKMDWNPEISYEILYRLSKQNDRWLIEDITRECSLCHGTGKDQHANSTCILCKGKGRKSEIFS